MGIIRGRKGYSPDRMNLYEKGDEILDLMGRLAFGYDGSSLEYKYRCHREKPTVYEVSGFRFTVSKKEGHAVQMWDFGHRVNIHIASASLLRQVEYLEAVRGIIRPIWESAEACMSELFLTVSERDESFWEKFHAINAKYDRVSHVSYMVGYEPRSVDGSKYIYFPGESDSKEDGDGLSGSFEDIGVKEIGLGVPGKHEVAYLLSDGSIGIGSDGKELRAEYDGSCFSRVDACAGLLDRMTDRMYRKAVFR